MGKKHFITTVDTDNLEVFKRHNPSSKELSPEELEIAKIIFECPFIETFSSFYDRKRIEIPYGKISIIKINLLKKLEAKKNV